MCGGAFFGLGDLALDLAQLFAGEALVLDEAKHERIGLAVEHVAHELAQTLAQHALAAKRRLVDERLARLVDEQRVLRGEAAEQRHHRRVRELVAAALQLGANFGDRAFAKLPQRLHDAKLGGSHLGALHYDDLRSITTTVVAKATIFSAGISGRYAKPNSGYGNQMFINKTTPT